MPIGTNDHRRFLYLLGVGRFDDVYDIKATQRCETIFPGNTGTLLLDSLRYGPSQVLEVLRIVDRIRGNVTEDHERRHMTPSMRSPYTDLLRASSTIRLRQ